MKNYWYELRSILPPHDVGRVWRKVNEGLQEVKILHRICVHIKNEIRHYETS